MNINTGITQVAADGLRTMRKANVVSRRRVSHRSIVGTGSEQSDKRNGCPAAVLPRIFAEYAKAAAATAAL